MFSIFEYLRRRTCDAFLAGAYDAVEILETENAKLPAPSTESTGTNSDASSRPVPNLLGTPKNGVAKILPLAHATPPAKSVAEQKNVAPPAKKENQKPIPPATPKPTPQAVPPGIVPAHSTPRTDLFTSDDSQEKPLPPRKRGRPRKNPPEGNS